MSEWITDRRPTVNDSDYYGYVWVTSENGTVVRQTWVNVSDRPWMAIITPPEPYMKPKRYQAKYNSFYGYWVVFETETLANVGKLYQLTENNDEHRRVAERIAEAYEEVMP